MSAHSADLPDGVESIFLEANGLRVHALAAGPGNGALVVLLHGFPELSRSWHHQLVALADAGYRAVAPDQRGYGGTTRVGPYDVETLSADVAAMIDALGSSSAVVVGHDWGGGVAWVLAGLYPQRVEALVVGNCPPPQVLNRALVRSPRQLRKSLYMFAFQLPRLPERALTTHNSRAIGRSLVGGSHVRGAFSPDEIAIYQRAFSEPGAATAALGWYRAAMRTPGLRAKLRRLRVSVPTLVIWGMRDRFLGVELVSDEALASVIAPGGTTERCEISNAGHFVQNEAPQAFNDALLNFLDRQTRRTN